MNSPWIAHYERGVPATLAPYPRTTLLDCVAERAARRPDHVALDFFGAELTYGELEEQSTAFAAALLELGVRPADCVALLLPNTPQFVIAQLAVWKVRGIVAPLNPIYTEDELRGAVQRVGARAVITLGRFYEVAKRIQPETKVRTVITTGIKEYLPLALRAMYAVLKERKEGDRITLEPGDCDMRALISANRGRALATDAVSRPDDTAVLLLSGGTTGTPKAVMGAHAAYTAAGLQLRTWLHSVLREWEDSILVPLPLFHVFGNVGVLSIALMGGNRIILVPNPRDIDALVKVIRRTRPAVMIVVPALLNAIMSHRDVRAGKIDFRSVKGCFSGAAPLLEETKRKFEQATGGRIIEGYSLTEAMMACLANPAPGPARTGSVGIPLPDVELRVVDADAGSGTEPADVPRGEIGEVILRAPQLMQGYWENDADTAATLRAAGPGKAWLFTGDLGYMDDDGYLFIVDRKKDLIKVSGMQVWPREIEEVIAAHPAVADVAVAGVIDARKGEVVQGWVVLRPGAVVSESELRAWCRERLAPYKLPARIVFRESLPRNVAGKVLRRELRAEALAVGS
jgi:long-chain acyl-CoA synthetase